MTTDTEALRAAFEDYINPEGDVALHWQPAGYYAGGGLQGRWLDFQSGYWAGYAAAKAETAAAGEPVAWCIPNDPCNATAFAWPGTDRTPQHNVPLFTADQLAAAVAAERERAAQVCDRIADDYNRREGLKYPELKTDAETGANDCADAIRAGAPPDTLREAGAVAGGAA